MTLSRRGLLGGGAVLAGATAVAVLTDGPAAFATDLGPADLEALGIPVMLSVIDAKSGVLELLVGEQAITFTDRALVSKLARTARKGGE